MSDKYIALVNGRLTTRSATAASAGVADAGRIPALDANGKLSTTLLPTGVGDDVIAIVASENLAAGDLVNVWNDAGTAKVRKADATTAGKEASGFVLVAVTATQSATVYSSGDVTGLAGLVPGTRYYLSTTAGQATVTPPDGSGNVVQFLGVAHNATTLPFEPGDGVVLE